MAARGALGFSCSGGLTCTPPVSLATWTLNPCPPPPRRPGPIVGTEDHFFNYLIYQLGYNLYAPVINGGVNRVQPTYVLDVSHAVLKCLEQANSAGKTYYLGGPETPTYVCVWGRGPTWGGQTPTYTCVCGVCVWGCVCVGGDSTFWGNVIGRAFSMTHPPGQHASHLPPDSVLPAPATLIPPPPPPPSQHAGHLHPDSVHPALGQGHHAAPATLACPQHVQATGCDAQEPARCAGGEEGVGFIYRGCAGACLVGGVGG